MGLGGSYVKFWDRGAELPSGQEVRSNIQNIITLIKEHNPDVVFLQEVSKCACVSQYVNLLDALNNELEPDYNKADKSYWQTFIPCYGSMCGPMDYSLVIFSKPSFTTCPSAHKLYVTPRDYGLSAIPEH